MHHTYYSRMLPLALHNTYYTRREPVGLKPDAPERPLSTPLSKKIVNATPMIAQKKSYAFEMIAESLEWSIAASG